MKKLLILFLALTMMALSACGSSQNASAQPQAASPGDPASADAPVDSAGPGESKRIVFMPYNISEEFYVDAQVGAQRAIDKLGWELIAMDPQNDLNMQIQFLEDLMIQGVDGIIMVAIDGDALRPVVQNVVDSGIKVVDFDIVVEGGVTDASVTSDNAYGGEIAARYLGDAMNGEGTVIVFEEKPGIGVGIARNEAFRDYMAANFPGITIVNNRPADTTRDGCRSWMVDMLTAYPEAKGVFTYMGDAALGAYYGAKELGRDDVMIMGYDASPEQLDFMIQDGPGCQLIASVAVYPFMYGRVCVETMADILNGNLESRSPEARIVLQPGLMTAQEAETYTEPE